MAFTAEEWHAWVPSTKEASPKAQAQKSPPRVCQGPCWQRWRLLGLYTLEWWDQDKCFWNWWLQNCMASQRWGIQRKMHGAYSETWWWQCPYVGLHECCWCRGAAFHWWHHEFTNVLLYTEREDATSLCALGRRALFQHDNDPKHTSKATVGFLKKNRVKVIQWPSVSPDLNPIEHLWGILKRQVEHHSPSSIQSLKEVILEEWKKIDLAKCRQLVNSMPRRLGAVITFCVYWDIVYNFTFQRGCAHLRWALYIYIYCRQYCDFPELQWSSRNSPEANYAISHS